MDTQIETCLASLETMKCWKQCSMIDSVNLTCCYLSDFRLGCTPNASCGQMLKSQFLNLSLLSLFWIQMMLLSFGVHMVCSNANGKMANTYSWCLYWKSCRAANGLFYQIIMVLAVQDKGLGHISYVSMSLSTLLRL